MDVLFCSNLNTAYLTTANTYYDSSALSGTMWWSSGEQSVLITKRNQLSSNPAILKRVSTA